MDYPRCATCKHWQRFERTEPGEWRVGGKEEFVIELPVFRADDGTCDLLPKSAVMIDADHVECYDHHAKGYAYTTHETFGCVLHEAKE